MKIIYILLVFIGVYTIIQLILFFSKKKKLKQLEKIKLLWGIPKDEHFNFEAIKTYFEQNQEEAFQVIDDKTILDLDLENVFKAIDHTKSKIGQQYFYNKFRKPNNSIEELKKLDKAVEYFSDKKHEAFDLQVELSSLDQYEDYYLPLLIFGDLPEKLKWLSVVSFLQFATLASLLLGFVYPPLFLVFIFLLAINMVLHFWNKNRIGKYTRIFNRLSYIYNAADSIHQKTNDELIQVKVEKDLKSVKGIIKRIGWIKVDSQIQDNEALSLVWFFVEIIKVITLTEFLAFYKVIDEINNKKKSFHQLFKLIGKVDFILSIASYRSSLDSFAKPIFIENQKEILIEKVRHPLLENCVANDIHLKNKSLLLTGSNMSGKTTFIRSMGVNVLLAQTIFTSLSEKHVSPFYKLATSIRITDDISQGESYYLAEVNSIKNLLEKSQRSNTPFLFIIDEVFKGTNTIERIGAAKAILNFLNQKNHLVLVSTHDIELTNFLKENYVLYHFQEQIENDNLFFDYQLKQGILQKRNAIRILELENYPTEVIEDARSVTLLLENKKPNL